MQETAIPPQYMVADDAEATSSVGEMENSLLQFKPTIKCTINSLNDYYKMSKMSSHRIK